MKTYKFYQPITVHINRDSRPVDDIEDLELIDGIPYVEQMNEAIQKDLEYTEGKGKSYTVVKKHLKYFLKIFCKKY